MSKFDILPFFQKRLDANSLESEPSEEEFSKYMDETIGIQKELIEDYKIENFHFVRKAYHLNIEELIDRLLGKIYFYMYAGDGRTAAGFEIHLEKQDCKSNVEKEIQYIRKVCNENCFFDHLNFGRGDKIQFPIDFLGHMPQTLSGFEPKGAISHEKIFVESIILFEQDHNIELWIKLYSDDDLECMFFKIRIPFQPWVRSIRPLYSEIRSQLNGLQVLVENHESKERSYENKFWNMFSSEAKNAWFKKTYEFYREVIDNLIIQELVEIIPSLLIRKSQVVIGEISSGSGGLAKKIIKKFAPFVSQYIMLERNEELVKISRKSLLGTQAIVIEKDILEEPFIKDIEKKVDIWISSGSVLSRGVGTKQGANLVFDQMYRTLNNGGFMIITGWERSYLTTDFFNSYNLEILNTSMPTLENHSFSMASTSSYLDFYVLRKK